MTGVIQTDTVLDRILRRTAIDLETRREAVPVATLEAAIAALDRAPRSLRAALDTSNVGVIAEIKRGSPSRGMFPATIEPAAVAEAYIAGGAVAISCLTDGPFFHGSEKDLRAVAGVAEGADREVPVLRKDFMIDRYQLLEARAWGADVVLLIVAALDDALLAELHGAARALGLSVLIEVHDEAEMERALRLDPDVVGVNNRDLRTFDVSLGVTERLAEMVPDETLLVAESGIFTADDVRRVAAAGADAVLVGESLIVQQDRAAAVAHLGGVPRARRG